MDINSIGLPELNNEKFNAIIDCVYGLNPDLEYKTKELLEEPIFKDLIETLQKIQEFNCRYRSKQLREMFDIASEIIDFEINSESTSFWMALLLGVKEFYDLKDTEIKKLLQSLHIKK